MRLLILRKRGGLQSIGGGGGNRSYFADDKWNWRADLKGKKVVRIQQTHILSEQVTHVRSLNINSKTYF